MNTPRTKAKLEIASLLPVAGILVLAALARIIPHTANVTPFFAVAIAAGAWLGRDQLKLAAALAIGSMFLSDLFIGLHWTMPFVYGGLAFGILVGAFASKYLLTTENRLLRLLKSVAVVGTGSLGFFIFSNIGVWLVGGIYPMTVDGLISCFVMAIPFFGKSLTSDLFFGSFFLMAVAQYLSSRSRLNVREGALNA